MTPKRNEVKGPWLPNVVAERVTTTYCLALPVALANSPVPPVTVSVSDTKNLSGVVDDWQTVPFNEANNWSPVDAVVVFEPVTGLLAPELQGGGGAAATSEPLVVPRNIGMPNVWPTEVVTRFVVDVTVPLPMATQGTACPPGGVADAVASKKVRLRVTGRTARTANKTKVLLMTTYLCSSVPP
jgi:hypothetical protein